MFIEMDVPPDKLYWKVVTPKANGGSFSFGVRIVASPEEVFTDTYIAFRVASREEAESLAQYLGTTFVKRALEVYKHTQDISKRTCRAIPLLPLDRHWDDGAVRSFLSFRYPDLVRFA